MLDRDYIHWFDSNQTFGAGAVGAPFSITNCHSNTKLPPEKP